MYKENIEKMNINKEELLRMVGYDPLLVSLRNIEIIREDDEVMIEVLIKQ